ncbi:SMP-30/gluconolactonase/LRE family protein [Aquimarina gracilis]|uniref:SMP-30/gluconolactonase/LRE family protein n=1 Tax=Aquimarina gracilis TaxID=874422 RepID=A0ABU5ZZH6_9FLAO|nr:SMP-30/gluconolactonase/LRE family protein [Aquimarina gracilis]MEB3347267.1 SMP-30/gluconolactonase/LRE family protein [Aquimarina gracilis]
MQSSISSFLIFIICTIVFTTETSSQSLNNSDIAFTIPEKDLLPESIAYDSINKEFYIGSTRKGKIVKVLENGIHQDFILSKQDGLWMVIGIKIDVKRRHLWVCSSGGDNLEEYTLKDEKEGRPAGIFKFNLDTKKLIKKYVLDTPGEVHFFNDLVIAKNGDVYITHMFSDHSLYKISKTEDQLKKMSSLDTIKYPNGISLSNDESKLYIAHSEGISMVNLQDASLKSVSVPHGIKLAKQESIDGLYFYKNTLIGIQPDTKTVIQLSLDKQGSKITKATLLEVDHPMMNNPTTGVLIEDQFYYVANAQFGSFNEDGSLFPSEKLYEVCILRLSLKNNLSKNEHYE